MIQILILPVSDLVNISQILNVSEIFINFVNLIYNIKN